MRRLFIILVAFCALIFFSVSPAPAEVEGNNPPSAPEALSLLIREGLSNNNRIKSLEAVLAASRDEVSVAGTLDDPRLGFGLLNMPADTFAFNQEPMTQKQISIAQKFLWFGKLTLRERRAAAKMRRQEALLEVEKRSLIRNITTLYYELGFVAKSQQINERLSTMVKRLIRIAEAEYASGRGLQSDVLRAQVEMSKLLDETITLKKKRHVIEARINELLNSERYVTIEPPAIVPYPDLKLNVDDLKARSIDNNPLLHVKKADVEQTQVAINLAEKDYYTDIDLKLSYGQRDDSEAGQKRADFVSASVSLSLPIWQSNKQAKSLAAAEKKHASAVTAYQDLVRRLPHQVDAVVTEIVSSQENYRLIADALLLQSAQWARSSLSAYEVGKMEFDTMITAWIKLLRSELQAESYLLTIYRKHAELEEILGGPVAQSDMTGTGSKD